MKSNTAIVSLVLLIIVAALYRVIPGRPFGFAPQIAMAIFAGAVIKDKKWAFALPIFSMFLSDCLYQLLFNAGFTDIQGFYKGQVINYVLFGGLTVLGFFMKQVTVKSVLVYSLIGPTLYFLFSNFLLWARGGGYQRPQTWDGLLMCFTDGLPFYKGSLQGTLVFSAILFAGYYLLRKSSSPKNIALAE
jgi:hypothetical protein